MEESLSFRSLVKWLLISVGMIGILFYVLFQARFLLTGPQIMLQEEAAQLQNERRVFLTGSAVNISRLWLNGRQIYTDAQGNFKEALILENGYTVATMRAEDRYGRETTVTRPFVYVPASFIQ